MGVPPKIGRVTIYGGELTGTGVTVYLDPLGSLTPGGQDTPGYLDPQASKYPLSDILHADTLIGVY